MSPLRIGIVGARFAAELHATNYRPLRPARAELTAVCSRTREEAERVARLHAIPRDDERSARPPPVSGSTPRSARPGRGEAVDSSSRAARRRTGPRRYRSEGGSCEPALEPVTHPLARTADVTREPPAVLLGEARERRVAPEVARPRPAAVVVERRVDDEAAPLALQHGE